MRPTRSVSRRSFMRQVTGGLALFGSGGAALAQKQETSDSDRYIADQPGQGRGPVSGITDQDPGDAVGNGSGNTRQRGTGTPPERPPQSPFNPTNDREAGTGITDSDPTDRVGYGRSRPPETAPRSPFDDPVVRQRGTGVTDSDPTDAVGFGTGRPQGTRNCTDSDVGNNADRSGQGRRC